MVTDHIEQTTREHGSFSPHYTSFEELPSGHFHIRPIVRTSMRLETTKLQRIRGVTKVITTTAVGDSDTLTLALVLRIKSLHIRVTLWGRLFTSSICA